MVGIQRCVIAHHMHEENMTNIEECKIYVTVKNVHNMKFEIKGTVNITIQGGGMVKYTEVLYAPQVVKNILSISRLVSKLSMIGDTQYNMTIN